MTDKERLRVGALTQLPADVSVSVSVPRCPGSRTGGQMHAFPPRQNPC